MFKEIETQWEPRLPSGTFAALRVDGKNFSRFTKPMRKDSPFSDEFSDRMFNAARMLAEQASGAVCVFTQSDEISVVFQDIDEKSEKWMGGRVQKIASIGAALASVGFNAGTDDLAVFDGRVFDLGSDLTTAIAYLKERYDSGVRNSVGMQASHYFSHEQLVGKSVSQRCEMLRGIGMDWENVAPVHRFGTLFSKEMVHKVVKFEVRGVEQTAEVDREVWKNEVVMDGMNTLRASLSKFLTTA